MNFEESLHMRHPNRLRTRPDGKRAQIESESARKRAEQRGAAQMPANALADGPHRKWMRNFSLHAGPPLWLLLKQG